jgi:hypothetical protein
MSVLGAFCNQLTRFFEELQSTIPEEKSISMALEAIKAAKRSNPKLILDMFHNYLYVPAGDMIITRDAEKLKELAKSVLSTRFNELLPALMIFDKYWPTFSENTKTAIWEYLEVLCKLCEKARV